VAPGDDEQSANPDIGTEEPVSPGGSEYFHAAEASRKRRSILSSRGEASSPNNSINFSPSASNTLVEHSISDDFPSPMSESALMTAADHKRVHRRTLLLLTRSAGVQTEPLRPSESGEHQMKPTLESAPTVMSKGTSPVLPADTSETSSLHENRNSVLLALIEQMSKVVGKVRSADIPTLNKRLKKQHLPGDVGHLSRSTLRNLQLEISDLRNHFRGGTDLGVLGRREFTLLLKLFKDVFSDLIDLQAIVNDVTVEPSLAKKLQKDAYRDEEEGDIKASKQASGLGWIAAPITKFFVTPAGEAADISAHHASPRPGRGQEKSRLQPIPVKAAPKQQASTSATATHISVEFGGSGMIRRATPMAPPAVQSVIDGLPPSPNSVVEELQGQQMSRTMSGSTASEKLAPPTVRAPGTLRPSRSRANRNELLGIFVGAARPVTHTRGGPWQILDNGEPPYTGGARTVRAVSSQSFGDKTVRQRDATNQCKPLSSNVNAVIDSAAEQLDTDDSATFHPAMLERTLRPEGLSDSSIRWTFVSDADQGEGFLATSALNPGPQPRTAAYGTPSGTEKRGGVFERITNRFYPFRGSAAEISGINPDAATIDPPPVAGHGVGPVAASSARIVTSTASVVSGSVTNSATAISSSQTGIFGLLASSLAGATEIRSTSQHLADEEEDEMVGASLRHPVHVPRSVRTSSGKGVWQ